MRKRKTRNDDFAKHTWRFIVWTSVCALGTIGVFFLRKRAISPLFALADAYSVVGFFALSLSLGTRWFKTELFDGFSYAFRSALGGVWSVAMTSYSVHKKDREERRGRGRVSRVGEMVGGAFLLLGLAMCLIFT